MFNVIGQTCEFSEYSSKIIFVCYYDWNITGVAELPNFSLPSWNFNTMSGVSVFSWRNASHVCIKCGENRKALCPSRMLGKFKYPIFVDFLLCYLCVCVICVEIISRPFFKWLSRFNKWQLNLIKCAVCCYIHEEIKSRLKSGNACCHSVQNFLSFSLLSSTLKIKIQGGSNMTGTICV